jgi:hypothetical protein
MQALTGNLPFQHRSWLIGSDVTRWFRIIGFVERDKEQGSILFELPPA